MIDWGRGLIILDRLKNRSEMPAPILESRRWLGRRVAEIERDHSEVGVSFIVVGLNGRHIGSVMPNAPS